MNKKIAEIIKILLDEFVGREEVLKELLADKDKKIAELEKYVDEVHK